MDKFNLKYPIFQAAPGGEELAIAIANAGGMGALSLGWHSPEDAYSMVKRVDQKTDGNYYANYVLHVGTASLDKTLEVWEAHGCPKEENKPGAGDTIANHPELGPTTRYTTMPPETDYRRIR